MINAPALVFDDVVVQYKGRDVPALNGVSISAAPGMVTAVVGPNGSGKSTLVRTLLHRASVRRGSVRIGDTEVTRTPARALARLVAVVPQREEPATPVTVTEFVAFGRHAQRSAFGSLSVADHRTIASALDRAGVREHEARRTLELSGGEWQRVRIARALAQDTPALVFDEPTAFLDIAHEMAVFELLDALAKEGRTILLVSHQLNLVARFASHIVLLHRGVVAAAGSVNTIMRGEILERVYEWPLVVTRDPAIGVPALLPLRRSGARPEHGSAMGGA